MIRASYSSSIVAFQRESKKASAVVEGSSVEEQCAYRIVPLVNFFGLETPLCRRVHSHSGRCVGVTIDLPAPADPGIKVKPYPFSDPDASAIAPDPSVVTPDPISSCAATEDAAKHLGEVGSMADCSLARFPPRDCPPARFPPPLG
jgi:hypothetical protein